MKWIGTNGGRVFPREVVGIAAGESGLEAIRGRHLARENWRAPHPEWLRSQGDENARLGAPASLRGRVEGVAEGSGRVVVTGQQVSLFGGPLYSPYKLLTAIALAEELERRLEVPVLPVFWSVSDDSDFGEVSSTWWGRPDSELIKLRDEQVPPGGTRIGTLPVERQRAALADVRERLADWPHGGEALSELDRLFEQTETWAQFQTALFHRLLPNREFLVVDGGDPQLLEHVDPWLRTAGEPDALRRDLRAGAEKSRQLGVEPAFEEDLADRSLFRLEGNARLLVEGDPRLASGPVAPNVVLRPLLQDYVFPNLATVCGQSEIDYRAQLGPVYRARGVVEPVRVPRLAGVLFPALPEARRPEDIDGYTRLAAKPKEFVKAQIAAEPSPRVVQELERVRDQLKESIRSLGPELEAIDKSLPQLIDSAAGKADYQFQRMQEGVAGKLRQQILRNEPTLSHLAPWLRPRDRQQERVLGALAPVFLEGWDCFAAVAAAAPKSLRGLWEGEISFDQQYFTLDPLDGDSNE